MTDNEIIKALECCKTGDDCKGCPYYANERYTCGEHFNEDMLDLINRQKAEIERLQNILLKFMDEVARWEEKKGIDVSELPLIPICDEGRDIIDHHRAIAIKQFAERLHEYINGIIERHEMPMFPFSVAFVSGMETKIDNLVKEMVGE